MVKQFSGNSHFNLPKILVTSIYGHEDMINYLSDYRTQDKMRGIHYYPKGLLCWFETNQYGEPLGSVYVIKNIPDMKFLEIPRRQRGYRQLLNSQSKKIPIKDLFTRERSDTDSIAVVKPKLHKYMKGEK